MLSGCAHLKKASISWMKIPIDGRGGVLALFTCGFLGLSEGGRSYSSYFWYVYISKSAKSDFKPSNVFSHFAYSESQSILAGHTRSAPPPLLCRLFPLSSIPPSVFPTHHVVLLPFPQIPSVVYLRTFANLLSSLFAMLFQGSWSFTSSVPPDLFSEVT